MKIIKFLIVFSFAFNASLSFGAVEIMSFSNVKGAIAADFPCKPENVNATGSANSARSLQCAIGSEKMFCTFLMSESNLDLERYKRLGMKWIEMIHQQFEISLNMSKSIYARQGTSNIGPTLNYEFIHKYEGHNIQANGRWIVHQSKLVRISSSCYPVGTTYLKSARERFYASITVLN
jgi:hypothetical protein